MYLSISQGNGKVHISVKDNGLGFDLATTPVGTGLESMRKRAEAIGARYQMHPQPGEGTIISVER